MPGTQPCGRILKRFPEPPPPHLPRWTSDSPGRYSELRASAVIVLAATVDLEAISRRSLADLPPSIWPRVAILGDLDWRKVCDDAIRAQRAMLTEPSDTRTPLLRADVCDLQAFLTSGSLVGAA